METYTCDRCGKNKATLYIQREAQVFRLPLMGQDSVDSWELEPHGNEHICSECYKAEYGELNYRDRNNLCGKPHNNGAETCNECEIIKLGI